MLSPGLIYLFSLASGVSVACIYLNQPLLHMLGQEFQTSEDKIGLLSSLTQIGYAAGLLFLVPLGDVVAKKRLILIKFIALAMGLLIAALSPSWVVLLLSCVLIGLVASAAQDFIPFAADLANDRERGRIIGKVMGGLFTGILCSRTFAGVLSDVIGWRGVFAVCSGIIVILAGLFGVYAPHHPPKKKLTYPRLIQSVFGHFFKKPALRHSILTHGLIGISFSAFWTCLSFQLGGPEFNLSNTQIGLFGLAGAAGVLAAPLAGKMADKRNPSQGIFLGVGLVTLSFAGMLIFPHSLVALVLGAIFFDFGLQMSMVSHQTIVYALDPAARSGVNAIYMSSLFLFLALGSFMSVRLQHEFGWISVLYLGLATGLLSLGAAFYARLEARTRLKLSRERPF